MWLFVAVESSLVLGTAMLFALGSAFVAPAWMMLPAVLACGVAAALIAKPLYSGAFVFTGIGLGVSQLADVMLWAKLLPWFVAAVYLGIGVWLAREKTTLGFRIAITLLCTSILLFLVLLLLGVDRDITSVPLFLSVTSAMVAWFYWQRRIRHKWKYVVLGAVVTHFLHALMLLLPATQPQNLVTALPIAVFYGSVLLYVVMHIMEQQKQQDFARTSTEHDADAGDGFVNVPLL